MPKHEGFTIWFTGLSGVGKSTIAAGLVKKLEERGEAKIEVLDGDVVRTHLSKGLGFSKEDRDINILRIGFVCELLSRNGAIAIAAAISPYREIRDHVRSQIKDFIEVFVSAPMETLVQRDVKGLYKKAIAGEIKNFTGVSDPYEQPLAPEVILETDKETIDISVNKLLRALELLGLLPVGDTNLSEQEEEKVIEQLQRTGRLHETVATSRFEDTNGNEDYSTIAPHGGTLVNRFLPENKRNEVIDRIEKYPSVTLSARQWSDIELIASGAYSPLTGFIGEGNYRNIIENGRLTNGLAWTIPILLLVEDEEADRLKVSDQVVLRDNDGKNIAILQLSEIFKVNKEELARMVWQTTDTKHPGVKNLFDEGDTALAGSIDVVRLEAHRDFPEYRLTPTETRHYFRERGWKSVVAFQTRNPIHRAHEYLQKVALEMVDGLLLHPLVGETKGDDIPAGVRMECYKTLLGNYYPQDRVLLSVMPAAMRYAGPREAIHHAIIRQNYGCTHFIVGRDHAGVGNYYGTYDAQKIFDRYSKDELGITPLKFEHTFYCNKCEGMASEKTCPHGADERIILSGTKVRERLSSTQDLPREFSRPEVVDILREHYSKSNRKVSGCC
ncbi:MAG TPA: sulfate adenylyltransferase [Candidatus Acidoferrales bacterium]|nr:sulfate adenylyltransferase [Candidatus Acidoferrales bacterium]